MPFSLRDNSDVESLWYVCDCSFGVSQGRISDSADAILGNHVSPPSAQAACHSSPYFSLTNGCNREDKKGDSRQMWIRHSVMRRLSQLLQISDLVAVTFSFPSDKFQ
jgi:hypothetical protein